MNANTTPFASAAANENQTVTRSVLTPVRPLRLATAGEGGHPQPLPLVLAVLPLRTVVREGRASPRHA